MRPACRFRERVRIGLTCFPLVSAFLQEAVDFLKIELTPVCLQSGEAFEITASKEGHHDVRLAGCGVHAITLLGMTAMRETVGKPLQIAVDGRAGTMAAAGSASWYPTRACRRTKSAEADFLRVRPLPVLTGNVDSAVLGQPGSPK
jgi:hypothetical protein